MVLFGRASSLRNYRRILLRKLVSWIVILSFTVVSGGCSQLYDAFVKPKSPNSTEGSSAARSEVPTAKIEGVSIARAIELRMEIDKLGPAPTVPEPFVKVEPEPPVTIKAFDGQNTVFQTVVNDQATQVALIAGVEGSPASDIGSSSISRLVADAFSIPLRAKGVKVAEVDYRHFSEKEREAVIESTLRRRRDASDQEIYRWTVNMQAPVDYYLIIHVDPLAGATSGLRPATYRQTYSFHEAEWADYASLRSEYLAAVEVRNQAVSAYEAEARNVAAAILAELKSKNRSSDMALLDFDTLSDDLRSARMSQSVKTQIERWINPHGHEGRGSAGQAQALATTGGSVNAAGIPATTTGDMQALIRQRIDAELRGGVAALADQSGTETSTTPEVVRVSRSELPETREEAIIYWQKRNRIAKQLDPADPSHQRPQQLIIDESSYSYQPLEMTVSARLIKSSEVVSQWSGVVTVRASSLAEVTTIAGAALVEMMLSSSSRVPVATLPSGY